MARYVIVVLMYGLAVCTGAPRKTVESNDIPKVQLSGEGVSASFGGYHASAGLGGSLDGGPAGGLFAEAGTPGGAGASAGLGGAVGSGGLLLGGDTVRKVTSAESDTTAGNHVPRSTKRPVDFYDNVFNIPISVLQAVNQLLGGTPKNGGSKVVHTRVTATSGAAPGTQTAADANGSTAPPWRSFFDDVFNIPISTLRAVNELLNGKNQGGSKPVKV